MFAFPAPIQQNTGEISKVKPPSHGLGPRICSTAARATPQIASHVADLASLAPYMFLLMLRNVTSMASWSKIPMLPVSIRCPAASWPPRPNPTNTPGVDQGYVYNWVRDAVITAIEIAAADLPVIGGGMQTLIEYVHYPPTDVKRP